MVTLPDVPSKLSAPPYLPAVDHVTPVPARVPLLPVPDESDTVVPLPTLNPQAPTRPVATVRVVNVAVYVWAADGAVMVCCCPPPSDHAAKVYSVLPSVELRASIVWLKPT